MYLYKKYYIRNSLNEADKQIKVTVPKALKDRVVIDNKKVRYITQEVAYWRKANQIHNWFVNNVIGGDDEDNGGDHYVTRKQLVELYETCKKVVEGSKLVAGKIKNGQTYNHMTKGWDDIMVDGAYIEDHKLAEELLPATDGFFFGSTDYDQYYIADLTDTMEMLRPVLYETPDDEGDYYYSANW